MKIVSAAEMREIDRLTSERFGVPSLTLMENAGSAVADFVLSHHPSIQRIGVICGKGNNGGDGFVAARKLHDAGREVRVLLLAEPSEVHGDAAGMLSRLLASPAVARSCGRSFCNRPRGPSSIPTCWLTQCSEPALNRRSAAFMPKQSGDECNLRQNHRCGYPLRR